MKKKLNIAFIGNQITFGGGATSLYLLVKSLVNKPVNKFVFASSIASLEMKENFNEYSDIVEKINLSECKSSQTSKTKIITYCKNLLFIRKEVELILNIIDEYDIDILHFNNSVFSHYYKYIKEKTHVKIVTHVREMIFSHRGIIPQMIVSNISKYSDIIITISDNESKAFEENENVKILANPFDFSYIHEFRDIKKEWNIREEVFLIGMIGRFKKSKGHLYFLEALKRMEKNSSNPPFKFVLVGISPRKPLWKRFLKRLLFKLDFREKVENFIKKNRLEDKLILVPYTKEIFTVINALDVIVRPSLYCDPWGRDIIESMALGKTIVAFGKSQFFIENNKSGFLIEKNVGQLVKKLNYLMNNPNFIEKAKYTNTNIIKEKCSLSNYGDEIYKIYNSIQSQ